MDDHGFNVYMKTKTLTKTPFLLEVSAGMEKIAAYKRRILLQQGGEGMSALALPIKSKRPKVYCKVKLGIKQWMRITLQEYRQHAETLPQAARTRLERLIKALEDCGRAVLRRFQTPATTPPSDGHAQSSARAKRTGTNTRNATSTADPKEQFRCGRRQCLFHRRRITEMRFDTLKAQLPDLASRAIDAAGQALLALGPRIEKAKDSYERFQDTPLADRQQDHLATLRDLRRELRAVDTFGNYLVTINLSYDPCNPADVTVPALRKRVVACKGIEQQLFEGLFRPELRPCVAWVSAIECGDHGLVHVHILYRGPERDEDVILQAARAACEGESDISVHLKSVKNRHLSKKLRYLTKPDGLKAADWHRFKSGERRNVPHPLLDARLMLATRGKRTFSARGLFRKGMP